MSEGSDPPQLQPEPELLRAEGGEEVLEDLAAAAVDVGAAADEAFGAAVDEEFDDAAYAAPHADNDDAAAAGAPPVPRLLRFVDDDDDEPIPPFVVLMHELEDPFPDLVVEHEANLRRRQQALEDADGDSYYEDTSDSDDETNLVDPGDTVVDHGLASHMLVDVLETYRRYRIRELTANFNHNVSVEYAVDFRRFVNALADYRRIRKLHLTRGNFWHDDDGNENDDDDNDDDNGTVDGFDPSLRMEGEYLERLFGEVLPGHPSLREITISQSRIERQYWRLFTENCLIANTPLVRLAIESTPLSTEDCHLLRQMLRREIQLFQLKLEYCGLGSEEWRVVAEGVADNTHLHTLTLIERDVTVQPGTLLPLLLEPSFVNHLEVRAEAWTAEAFEEFVTELRTNEVLRDLTLTCDRRREIPHLRLAEELLATYNWTLETVAVRPCGDRDLLRRIGALLGRNQRVRELGHLHHNRRLERYHRFSSHAEWPRVLEQYGRFPSLLYRFVRQANLEAFASQVQQPAAAGLVDQPMAPAAEDQHAADQVQPHAAEDHRHAASQGQPAPAAAADQHAASPGQPAPPAAGAQHPAQGANKRRRQLISE